MSHLKPAAPTGHKNRTKKLVLGTAAACLALCLTVMCGCSSGTSSNGGSPSATQGQASTGAASTQASASTAKNAIESDASVKDQYNWGFSDRDLDPSYDAATATKVALSDSGSTIDGSGAAADGSTVTITQEGTYILSGTLSNGSVVVSANADTEKVQLVLDGVDITCENGAAIVVESADKVFVTLADGSSNTLKDGSTHDTAADGNDHDAVIFSHEDITFNGSGSLAIDAQYKNGISGKDDVRITGGTYTITAAHHGIEGKDCVKINDGTFTITAGQDGIHSSNDEDAAKGFIGIGGGTFTITVDDDGMHAETALLVAAGNINITQSYEGLEGKTVSITGGDVKITASDDGMNATDGSGASDNFMGGQGTMPGGAAPGTRQTAPTDTSGSGDGAANTNAQGGQPSSSTDGVLLEITGGTVYVKAGGDCLDSNGDFTVSGGTTTLDCVSGGGDAALDYDGTGVITGGTLTAVGPSNMALGFTSGSTQASLMVSGQKTTAGQEVAVTDASGNVVYAFTPAVSSNNIVVSTPEIKDGESYTLSSGGTTLGTATASTTTASAGGGMGGAGKGGPRGAMG